MPGFGGGGTTGELACKSSGGRATSAVHGESSWLGVRTKPPEVKEPN